jgi:hypothetical protein
MALRNTTYQTTFICDVQPGIGTLRGAIANGSGPKAFVLLVRFYDAQGNLIPGPYLRFSHSQLGSYRYLSGGIPKAPAEFDMPIFMPDGATRLDAIFCAWEAETPIIFARAPQASGQIKLRSAPPAKAAPPPQILVGEGRFEPGHLYQVQISVAPGQGDAEKAHLLVVECYDAAGQLLHERLPGMSYSETAGCYVYLSFAAPDQPVEQQLKLVPPEGAVGYRIHLRRWRGSGTPQVVSFIQRELLNHGAQVEFVTRQAEEAIAQVARRDGLVVITATTRALESENRLNRPQVLAQQFAQQGFLTFYVYYRFDKTDPLPERNFEGIVQIPQDIFQILAPMIARAPAQGPRIAIFSIPDDNSVRQLGVFKRYRWRTVYEARDDWEEFAAANVGKWYNPLWERFLTSSCDRTICVSPALTAKMVMLGCPPEQAQISPNATTTQFVEVAARYRRRRVATPLRKSRPVLGYFGHLTNAWFDWPLIARAALLRPDWDFECIGFGEPSSLRLPQNVRVLEAVPQLELPRMTRKWTLGLIPFRPSVLSRAVDPIKIYDYLALGLPTLSVRMGRIETLDNVMIYEGVDDFLLKADALIARLRSGPFEWPTSPHEHTWNSRVRQIVDICTEAV